LGIGDWAQSPIPNPHPQSPLAYLLDLKIKNIKKFYNKYKLI